MLIFDRCLHTVTVVRPVKYECDLKDLIDMLLKRKKNPEFPLKEK